MLISGDQRRFRPAVNLPPHIIVSLLENSIDPLNIRACIGERNTKAVECDRTVRFSVGLCKLCW